MLSSPPRDLPGAGFGRHLAGGAPAPRFRPARVRLAVLLAAPLLGLSACTAAPAARTAGPPVDVPPDGALAAITQLGLVPGEDARTRKAVEGAERYLDAFEKAIAAPERSDPDALAAVATGTVLSEVSDQLDLMRREKLVARGTSERRLVLLGRRDGDWYVMNCTPHGQVVIHDAVSGRQRENVDPGFAVTILGLREQGAVWKVHRVMVFSESRCPA